MAIGPAIIAISLGAAIGANMRWVLGLCLNAMFPAIPPGTLAANLLGAWLVGIAIAAFAAMPDVSAFWRLFVVTGFLGALTTFSAFSAEMFANIQAGRIMLALVGIALHMLGSLAMTGLGLVTFSLLYSFAK